ncbi:hypothetical protein [Halomarina rubra]|uniref:Uncharacterized protein n=1 Tax=Halomarina rubra TaxID=2071873 RepID=A0ABD6ATY6_9EURY|nr:hypothetical protein [Halomarina rubra]
MNSPHIVAYDDASYAADEAVTAARSGDFDRADDRVRAAFAAVRASPYHTQVETVHTLGVDAVDVLAAEDATRDSVLPTLEAFRAAVELCHVRVHADARSA